jgi:hypothetical protein
MDIIQEIGAEPEHIGNLVNGIMNKLLPKQLHYYHADYGHAISKIAEFIAITGFPYKPNDKLQEEFISMFNDAFTRWTVEDTENEWNGYHEPLRFSLDMPKWGIVANQLSIPVSFDENLMPIFDFEFYHWDYGNEIECYQGGDFLTLDLIHAAQLYGFANQLKTKMPDNPHDKRCVERDSRKATGEDIDKYIEEEEGKRLSHLLLNSEKDDVNMSFLTPDGTILYTHKVPDPPRKLHTYEEIQDSLSKEVVKTVESYCNVEGEDDPEGLYKKAIYYEKATNLMCRRNRVKEFLGSDIEVPSLLVSHHKEFWDKFNQKTLEARIRKRVDSYNPRSLSYGLDIPSNFTLAEYCFFRYMDAFTTLSRRGSLLYDTPEKSSMLGKVDLQKIPIEVIKMGYQEALSFEKQDRRR